MPYEGLRRGDREGFKNAIRDSSNAVETTMKAVIDARGLHRTGTETAVPSVDDPSDGRCRRGETQELLCGPSKLRNTFGGHGPDPAKDVPVPHGIPAFSVQTAAAVISYLAVLLP